MKKLVFLFSVVFAFISANSLIYGKLPQGWSRRARLDKVHLYRGIHEGKKYLFFATMVKSKNQTVAREKGDLSIRASIAEALGQEFSRQLRFAKGKVKKLKIQARQERIMRLRVGSTSANVSGTRIFKKLAVRRGAQYYFRILGGIEYELFQRRRLEVVGYAWNKKWMREDQAKELLKTMQRLD